MSDEQNYEIGGNVHGGDGSNINIGGTQNIYYSGSPPGGQSPGKGGGKPRVFISYSRADGEEFATDLRGRLEAEVLTLWQDRAQMEGGVGWWKQIKDALEAVEFMVLVATPAAIASPIVKKEWRYARQQGVCVYPVQVPGLPLDFAAMPKWMRDSHFYNLDHEWETFVNYLKFPCTVPKVPFMAPDLPEHFVPRPEKFDPLKRQLLDADFDNPVAITTALKGAGGFGKTTLAAALCHDEDIQTAFDEGVLWVTLGENPNIINKLTVLYRALTDETPGFIEIEEGANKLAEKLVDADVLLVIDDVWNPAHLRPFLRGGERVARLVTTRFSNIAVDAKAKLLEVDEMTADESVQMLLAGIEPPDDLTPFKALAERLGEWALMLKLANGMLREELLEGGSLDDALAYVNGLLDEEGVAAIESEDGDERKQSAEGVLAASLRQLKDAEVTRLCELSIFVENTDVPTTSVEVLWGLSSTRTRKLLIRLGRGSFITFDRERAVIRLHSVVREVLASRLDDPAAVHAQLLDNYGDLTNLPDEYAWRNIAYHAKKAGQENRLHDAIYKIAYIRNKLINADVDSLSADYDLFSGDTAAKLMLSFWRLSSHVLSKPENHTQLYGQIIGRLANQENPSSVLNLFHSSQRAVKHHTDPLLVPQPGNLRQAGRMLDKILTGHQERVEHVSLLNQTRFASSDNTPILCVWEDDGKLIQRFQCNVGSIEGVASLNSGNDLLLTWSNNNNLQIWNPELQNAVVLKGHECAIRGVRQVDADHILSWSKDDTLRLWKTNGELVKTLDATDATPQSPEEQKGVIGNLVLQDGRILSWHEDYTLRFWSSSGDIEKKVKASGSIDGVIQLNNERLLSWGDTMTI